VNGEVDDVVKLRRWPIFLALAVLAAGGGFLDRSPRAAATRAAGVARASGMPIAAPPTSLSSTWFCAGATGSPDGVEAGDGLRLVAAGSVVVANASNRALHGVITVVSSEGQSKTVPLSVGARSRTLVREGDVLAGPYVASLVELDGGDVVVDHQIDGALGFSTAPCASSAGDHWYLADGSTARDDRMLLALYNPFPEDAIVDLSFSTDQGRAVPSDFTGLVVKSGSLRMVNVGDHVRRRNNVAMTAVARSGRLVINRIQVRTGAAKSLSLALAAPSPGSTWYFPEGLVSSGVTERYQIYNPTSHEADVTVEMTIEKGSAEPFDLTIPPGERITLNANDEERIPRDVGHAATVRSLNGVPVVAERTILATAPSARTGGADTLGARQTARRWVLAAGEASDSLDEWVVLINPGAKATTVSMRGLAAGQLLALESLQSISVPAGRRVAIRLTDHTKRDDLSVLVSATRPIVVERGMYRVGSIGLAVSAGIPLR